MSSKILIMGSSKQQNTKEGVMPALLRFNSLRWQVLRGTLPTLTTRPRILVLTPKYGFISVSQPVEFESYAWTGSTWRKDIPKIHASYDQVLRPRIDPGSNVFVSADAIQQMVMDACGLRQDIVSRGASMWAPVTTHGTGIQQMCQWLLEGVVHVG
jgi:hypothetical protein